jgi:hypothetical protein
MKRVHGVYGTCVITGIADEKKSSVVGPTCPPPEFKAEMLTK